MQWVCRKLPEERNNTNNYKAILDKVFSQDTETEERVVLESTILNNVYYCACCSTFFSTGETHVFCGIAVTSKRVVNGYNFAYIIENEEDAPCHLDCPTSILDKLTPTENRNANIWRERCRNKYRYPRLSKIKVGDKIKVIFGDEEIILTKMDSKQKRKHYSFKNCWWYNEAKEQYIPARTVSKLKWEALTESEQS